MRHHRFAAAFGSLALLIGGTAWAAPRSYDVPEPTAELLPVQGHEAGFEAAQTYCTMCHSVDYILTQPPGKGAAFWSAEVTKMVKVFHAPIEEAEAKAIAAYLAAAY